MNQTNVDAPSVGDARAAVKEQASRLGADVRELASLVREEVRAELTRARDQGQDVATRAREKIDDVESSLAGAVRSHPVRSLAWAAGCGLVLGILARR